MQNKRLAIPGSAIFCGNCDETSVNPSPFKVDLLRSSPTTPEADTEEQKIFFQNFLYTHYPRQGQSNSVIKVPRATLLRLLNVLASIEHWMKSPDVELE